MLVDEGIKENQIASTSTGGHVLPSQHQQRELPTSYQALHADYARRLANVEKSQREMIDYVAQWDQVVTTRVCAELRHVKKLQSTWLQYELKVQKLKASVAKKQKKEKQNVDLSKITRNEAKLRRAKKEYRNNVICTTLLVEEIAQRGWKDLAPLVLKMIENDVECVKEASCLLGPLCSLQNELRAVCSRFEMTEDECRDGRLRLLLEEDATDFARPEDIEDMATIEAFTIYPTSTIGSVSSNEVATSAPIHTADTNSGKSSPSDFRESDGNEDEDERTAAQHNAVARNLDIPGEGTPERVLPPSPTSLLSTTEKEEEAHDAGHVGEENRSKNAFAGNYLLSSFYIVYDDNDDGENDDLTTLTPYTRCERRISI